MRALFARLALVLVMAAAADSKTRPCTTPATRKSELSSILEACRAMTLAAHSAAGIASAARERHVARLLRSAEALARAAVAAVPGLSGKVSPVQVDGPSRAASGRRGDVSPVPGQSAASAVPKARPRRRRRKKNNKENQTVSMKVDIDDDNVEALGGGGAPASAPAGAPTTASPSQVLAKQSSRERSPRRAVLALDDPQRNQSVVDDGSAAAPSAAAIVASPSFAPNQDVIIGNLASRPDLSGCRAVVVSYDTKSDRYAIRLESTGDAIRVKGCNLRPSIFCNGAFASS